MARILARVLKALDNIYRFDSDVVAPDEVDLSGPIQLVHDVSRETELASAPGLGNGYFNISIGTIHGVAASTIFASQDITAAAAFWATLGASPDTHDIWILEITARAQSTLAVTEALVAAFNAIVGGAFTDHQRLIWTSSGVSTGVMSSGGSNALIPNPLNVRFPVKLVPGATGSIAVQTTASGAVQSITHQLMMWVGLKGTQPPGLW